MFETEHQVQSEFETIYQRDYSVLAPDMRRLYENAKRDQWNVSKDIDWSTPVDLEKGIFADGMIDGYGSPQYEKLDDKTKRELNIEFSCWRLSQLLHGEEGAMRGEDHFTRVVREHQAPEDVSEVQLPPGDPVHLPVLLVDHLGVGSTSEARRCPPSS